MAERRTPEPTPCKGMRTRWLSVVTLGVAVTYLAVDIWPGEEPGWLVLIRYAPALAAAALPLLLAALCVVLRARGTSACNLALAVLAFAAWAPPVWSARTDERGLRILTYNIHAGLAGPPAIGDFIRGTDADLVLLQEARAPLRRPDDDPVPAIAAALPDFHLARGATERELCILSRFPLSETRQVPLDAKRAALVTRAGGLWLVNVHLYTPAGVHQDLGRFERVTRSRVQQIEALTGLCRTLGGPVVITGDFNMPPVTEPYHRLATVAADAFAESGSGFGFTFSRNLPLWRIDYVWTANGVVPLSCDVLAPPLSDHRAVLARVRLPPAR